MMIDAISQVMGSGVGDAVDTNPGGFVIRIEVSPGASSVAIPSGYNLWRRSIEVRLTERAERGRANRQLLEGLSDLFGVPVTDIEIKSGEKSSRKVLLIRGMDRGHAVAILESALSDGGSRADTVGAGEGRSSGGVR